jgi:hypothetical protein
MKLTMMLVTACWLCSVSLDIPCQQQPQAPSSPAVLDNQRLIDRDNSVLSLTISPDGRGESIYEGGNLEMWTFPDLKPLKRFGSGLEKDGVTYLNYWFLSHRLVITPDSTIARKPSKAAGDLCIALFQRFTRNTSHAHRLICVPCSPFTLAL